MQKKERFGLKINNFQAAIVYEHNQGVRDVINSTQAMLTNSLLLDFLLEHGLNVIKQSSTRDVICLQFDFGTSSFEQQISKLEKAIKKAGNIEDETKRNAKIDRLVKAELRALSRQPLFQELSKAELRTIIYENGVTVPYPDGEIIHYRPAYRSSGKAKTGQVMCIRDELYDEAIHFLHMGLEMPEHDAPLVEMQAYSALISSTIVGRVKIRPEEILVIEDIERTFNTDILSVEVDQFNHCYVKDVENYPLKNVLFDGQALIDKSIFPDWANDYILLRQHFTKCAAFATDIQLFMKDTFKERYEYATVKDMFGNDVPVKNIKLICTDTALKFLKFNVSFEYWSEWVRKNGCLFGIVKTAHPSKVGHGLQRASYQICNSLNLETMDKVVESSREYVAGLKNDDDFFLDYLSRNINFYNDFDVLLALVEQDREFMNSEYFRERRNAIIASQIKQIRSGKLLLNAENLVIVGSPYAMLLASVGKDPDLDNTFGVESVAIQCYTKRFQDGQYLAFMRSPFNGFFNMTYLHNTYHPYFDRYFHFGDLVIAVNLIGTAWQARNNGSD